MYVSAVKAAVEVLDRTIVSAIIVLGGFLLPVESRGQETDAGHTVPARASIRSATGRFVVAATDAVDRITLARWADDVYLRFMEAWGPFTLRLPPDQVFGLTVGADFPPAPGGIERQRRSESGRMHLTMRISSSSGLDAEFFIESVCAMILDAMICAEQRAAENAVFDESVPAWMAVGMAQSLYPALAERNRGVVINQWRIGHLPDADTILAWRYLPPHRVFEKAVSAVWVAWLAKQWPQPADALTHWIRLLADGQAVTPGHLFAPDRSAGYEGDEWSAYVASLQRLFSGFDAEGAALRFERYRRALSVAPGVGGIPARLELAEDAGLDAMIPYRHKAWFGVFVSSRRAELASLALAGDPEHQDLVNRAIACLDGILGRRPGFLLRRDYRALLSELDRQEALALSREQYVILLEQQNNPDDVTLPPDGGLLDAPPRSAMRRYVDGFEAP